jgi:hypothetical protein
MSKKEAMKRARRNWGPNGTVHVFPRSRRFGVGVLWGECASTFSFTCYGLGNTIVEAFKRAEARFPRRQKGVGR